MTARKPATDQTPAPEPETETVSVRFPEQSYGIAAGEVRKVTAQRADELIAAGLAEPAQE